MGVIQGMNRAVLVLALAAGMSLCCQAAFAEEEEPAISAEQEDAAAAEQQDAAVAQGASDAATQGDAASDAGDAANAAAPKQGNATNAAKGARKPEKKGKEADASIPSANPDDANKHGAWRKRNANKSVSDLPNIRRSMMQQGNQ